MYNYAVAINRQFGSLGRPIAKELAKLLSIEYYDRDITCDMPNIFPLIFRITML